MSTRVAIFGGSFDPIHHGHLIPTIRALETFQFDAVHLVPAGRPPHKKGFPLTSVVHRYAMVALATLPHERIYASDLEVLASGPSFTVDTVRRFSDLDPGAELYFLLGSDSFSQIGTWNRWEELVELAHLVVLHRAHMWGEELAARLPAPLRSRLVLTPPFTAVPDPRQPTVYLLDHEPFPISATSIRERLRQGLPIRELVPHEVSSYVDKYALYRHERDG